MAVMSRSFRILWMGESVSLVGTATTATLLPLLAVELGAGPGTVGILAAATWAPWLLLGLPAGDLIDRHPPRTVMMCADLVAAAAALTMPVMWAMDRLVLAHLMAAASVIGCAAVFFRAALPRMITRVVVPAHFGTASSRLFGTEAASAVVGPGLAGVLAQTLSAAGGLLLDALSFGWSALCLRRIPPDPEPTPHAPTEAIGRRIRAGIAVVASDRFLRYFALLAAVQNFGLTGLVALEVLFLADDLAAAPAVIGLVLAASGVGGVLGAAIAPRLGARLGSARASMVLQLTSCGYLLVPLATPGVGIGWMVAGLLVGSMAIVGDNVVRSTWRLAYVPDRLQARMTTTLQMLAFATMPFAGLAAGWLGHELGVRTALVVLLGIHVAAALTMPFGPIGGLRDLPEPTFDDSPHLEETV